jgi:two-component system, OmpR family, alkaline phosphatase synthesis response regulator PhoP
VAKEKILVVDDESKIVDLVSAYLKKDGYRVVAAADGRRAVETYRREKPDLVVLDLMLPEKSGWDVCREIRATGQTPIIMVTAADDDADKIAGLEMGADDYLTKPFNPRELLARVRAVLRRVQDSAPAPTTIVAGDLTVDAERHEVRRGDNWIALTPTEFGLLETMARQPGRVFSRLQLLEATQGEAYEGYERAIDSHIKNLRQKVELDPRHPAYVLTVFGVGYKLADAPRE